MLSSIVKLFVSGAIVVLVCCTSFSRADAAVFRDRTAFNVASQNLKTIDFESGANVPDGLGFLEIDGVVFTNANGVPVDCNWAKWQQAPACTDRARIYAANGFPSTRYNRRRM